MSFSAISDMVVFSIAVGVFSIGVIAGAYEIISSDMSISYAANNPANIEFRMTNFDENILCQLFSILNILQVAKCGIENLIFINGKEVFQSFWITSF